MEQVSFLEETYIANSTDMTPVVERKFITQGTFGNLPCYASNIIISQSKLRQSFAGACRGSCCCRADGRGLSSATGPENRGD